MHSTMNVELKSQCESPTRHVRFISDKINNEGSMTALNIENDDNDDKTTNQ